MLSTQRFLSRMAASRVHGVGGSGKQAGGKKPSGRRLRVERLEQRTVLSGGVVLTLIAEGYSSANASFLEPGLTPAQDRIVVVGSAGDWGWYRQDFAVLHYQADGTLDPSFGDGDGLVTTNFGGSTNDAANAGAPYPDGRFVLGGSTYTYAKGAYGALARYNADGSLDRTFGKQGKVVTDFRGVWDVAVDSEGRILVYDGAGDLMRYTASGSLDTSFGGSGIVDTAFNVPLSMAFVNDEIYVTGYQKLLDANLARYHADGALDTGFGNAGFANHPDFYNGIDLAVQQGGKILVLGWTVTDFGEQCALLRVNNDGSLDDGFGQNGLSVVEYTNYFGEPYFHRFSDVGIQPDGKIVLVGTYYWTGGIGVVRLNADGSLDTGFGNNGYVITPVGDDGGSASSVLIQPDGKIVVTGNASVADQDMIALARYLPNGTLDETFGVVPPWISIDDVSVTEGNSGTVDAVFTVTLSEALGAAVTVDFATANGSATAGSDYLAVSGTLTFNPGDPLTQTIIVTVYGDTTKEANETFLVNLTNATGGAVISDGQGIGTIKNDDRKPPKGSSAELSAADLFFFNLDLTSEKDNDKTDPLATQAADELALMLVE